MSVTVVTSGGNLNVTTSQKTLVGTPGTFENSDASFSVSVASGGTTIGADITLTKNDNTTVSAISNIDLDLGVIDPFPATWDEKVAEYGRGYSPPLSGQTISYRTGDDADIEDTLFAIGRVASKLKAFNTKASFLVLTNNNAFENKSWLTDDVGGQTYANDNIIDHITGLMYNRIVIDQSTNWDDRIDSALASTVGSYSDWFVSSQAQVSSLFNFEPSIAARWLNYNPFNLIEVINTSTTALGATTNFLYNNFSAQRISYRRLKTNALAGEWTLLCRKHF